MKKYKKAKRKSFEIRTYYDYLWFFWTRRWSNSLICKNPSHCQPL